MSPLQWLGRSFARRSTPVATLALTLLVAAGPQLARADDPATVGAGSPGSYVTTVSTATVPVTLSRTATTPILGYSVTLTLSAGLTTTTGSFSEGGFLVADGATTTFQVVDNGGGSYTVDAVTLGMPCGSSATNGTLFSLAVGSTLTGGSGTVTITSVTLRDCSNASLPSAIGTTSTVGVDRSTPSVTLISPNGGESWAVGSSHAITWTATDAEGIAAAGITLEYSVNNGSSWLPVASGLANSGSFAWTVPNNPGSATRVRATAADTHGNTAMDASNAAFTILTPTTTSVTPSPSPSVVGQSVAITATVTPSSATGTVEFFDGATSLGTAPLAGGTTVLNTAALAVGAHSLTAVYSGDATFNGSTSAASAHTVNPAATSTSLGSAPNPSVTGQSIALTAGVSVTAPGAGSPSGTVEFFDGATSLGTAPLSGGTAVLNTAALAAGAHSLTAVYSGDTSFGGSTSAAHAHTVNPAATSTSLGSAPNPSTFGGSVTLTAGVSVTAPGAGSPTGTVQFFDGVTSLGSAPLSGGTAVLATSALAAGTHSLTAVYSGDASFSTSTSTAVSQVVNAATTAVVLAAAPNPGVFLDPETLTATVTPAGATGSVEFFDGATSLGTAPVSSGTAVLVTSALAVGTHSLTATYLGDANHSAATSSAVSLEIRAKIVATAGANGSISPSGTVLVSLGATPAFTFSADPGYHVSSVTVDGAAAPLTSPYTFAAVSSNHTIDVQFVVNPPVPAITTLAATQVRTGNDTDGTTKITLTWSAVPVGSTVEVWRKGFGNYPEYDDGPTPGAVPAAPASYPPSGWTLTAAASPGATDEPGSRDFWYYVAYVRDGYGTLSPVSNRTGGTLNYHLGDVTQGDTPGTGDNKVHTADVSLLGMHYGITGGSVAAHNYLDVGPTTDFSTLARPTTDNRVDFEDLVMFALNYFPVASAPQARALPAAAANEDALGLEAPAGVQAGDDIAVRVMLSGTGRVLALSVKLEWNPAIVTPVSYAAGDLALSQGGLVVSAEPGSVDGAVFTGSGAGFVGDGEFATIHFHAVSAGAPAFGFASTVGRDAQNHPVPLVTHSVGVTPRTFVTAFAPVTPNPAFARTTFRFSLAEKGPAELELFAVDGSRVRTLASGVREAGEYTLEWPGSDDSGRPLAAGIYYARLRTAKGAWTRTVTFLR